LRLVVVPAQIRGGGSGEGEVPSRGGLRGRRTEVTLRQRDDERILLPLEQQAQQPLDEEGIVRMHLQPAEQEITRRLRLPQSQRQLRQQETSLAIARRDRQALFRQAIRLREASARPAPLRFSNMIITARPIELLPPPGQGDIKQP